MVRQQIVIIPYKVFIKLIGRNPESKIKTQKRQKIKKVKKKKEAAEKNRQKKQAMTLPGSSQAD